MNLLWSISSQHIYTWISITTDVLPLLIHLICWLLFLPQLGYVTTLALLKLLHNFGRWATHVHPSFSVNVPRQICHAKLWLVLKIEVRLIAMLKILSVESYSVFTETFLALLNLLFILWLLGMILLGPSSFNIYHFSVSTLGTSNEVNLLILFLRWIWISFLIWSIDVYRWGSLWRVLSILVFIIT